MSFSVREDEEEAEAEAEVEEGAKRGAKRVVKRERRRDFFFFLGPTGSDATILSSTQQTRHDGLDGCSFLLFLELYTTHTTPRPTTRQWRRRRRWTSSV